MEENNTKNTFEENAEEIKKETKETVKQVKDAVKNVDFKKDTEETKGFLKDMFSNPFETLRKVSYGEENVLTKDIIIMVIFIALSLAYGIANMFSYGKFWSFSTNFKSIISSIIEPIINILIPSVVCYLMLKVFKRENRSIVTVLSTLIVAYIPKILVYCVNILSVLLSGILNIAVFASPLNTTLNALSVILTYFGMKGLFGEEEDMKFIKYYVLIKFLASLILYFI